MLLDFETTKNKFNTKIFENSRYDLIRKMSESPERYTGNFRSTLPKDKLIQNISQSQEINFGDAMELLIEDIFCLYEYTSLEKRYTIRNGDVLSYDQLFSLNNRIIFIEQKVRDDHDSTKKKGQVDNFKQKLDHLIDLGYSKESISSYMYFIDDAFKKNKNYYNNKLIELSNEGFNCKVVYGEELFKKENILDGWSNGVVAFLKQWRENLPGTPELNFDLSPEATFNELKNLKVGQLIKLLKNNEIINNYFPLIFPNKTTLEFLLEDCKKLILDDQTSRREKKKQEELKLLLESAIVSY
tara:strand:- start:1055 stop:1951 length:897 start_codon:yes stop_codon:yes gene_type:complete